jgi:hypothetical protein
VRELAPDQLTARRAAMTSWRAAFMRLGAAAVAAPPPELAAALAPLGESSGEEASDDEHYQGLHKSMEEEEARRLSGFAGTGAQRGRGQNKTAAQQSKDSGDTGGPPPRGPPEKRGAPDKRRGAPPNPSPAAALKLQQAAAVAASPLPIPEAPPSPTLGGFDGGSLLDAFDTPGPEPAFGLGPFASPFEAAPAGPPSATPTVVRRATASGPAASALKRAGSGALGPRGPGGAPDGGLPAPGGLPVFEQEPQGLPRQQQAPKPSGARPARTR